MRRRFFIALPALAASCRRESARPVDVLARRLPSGSIVLSGADLDRLRASELFTHLPQSWRNGSYVLAAYDGKGLTVAALSGGNIEVTGTPGQGAPPDLMARAPDAPLWAVVRGGATLPLNGNLANVNNLIAQTQYTVVSIRPAGQILIHAEGVCRTPEQAEHLEGNARAIGSLMRVPIDVKRDGATVRVDMTAPPGAIERLFELR